MSPAEVVQIDDDDEQDEARNRIKSLHDRLAAARKRFKFTRENGNETAMRDADQPLKNGTETSLDNSQPSEGVQDVTPNQTPTPANQTPTLASASGQNDSAPASDKATSITGKSIINLEPESPPSKVELRKFVNLFMPVLKDVPDWVSGRYLEFKDDSIRLCSRCKLGCEWIYFQPQGTRKELCAKCLKLEGSPEDAQMFLREGVINYLNALDVAAISLLPDQQQKGEKSS